MDSFSKILKGLSMISRIDNTQPNFGAIVKPVGKKQLEQFAQTLNLSNTRAQKGLIKLVKRHEAIKRDVKMDFAPSVGYKILGADGKWFYHAPSQKKHGAISNFFRKVASIFNPIKALPRDFVAACNDAEQLWKNEKAKERILEKTEAIFAPKTSK